MKNKQELDPQIRERLLAYYQQVMWLARQPGVTPSMARAWFTHIAAGRLARNIKMFSGKVSAAAARDPDAVLRLEHFSRMQTTLTQLVGRHLKLKAPRPKEFIATVVECEQVHIVTFRENYEVMKAKGDYKLAGIILRRWDGLPPNTRRVLWSKMLRGRVANAAAFAASHY